MYLLFQFILSVVDGKGVVVSAESVDEGLAGERVTSHQHINQNSITLDHGHAIVTGHTWQTVYGW